MSLCSNCCVPFDEDGVCPECGSIDTSDFEVEENALEDDLEEDGRSFGGPYKF